jgi:hypothetical protein
VATGPAGNFVVAWESPAGLFARRFDSTGTAQGAPIVLATNVVTPTSRTESVGPVAGMDDDGNFAIAYTTTVTDLTAPVSSVTGNVFVQQFDRLGQIQGGELRANTADILSSSGGPSLGANAGGDFVIAWSPYDPASLNSVDIVGRLFRSTAPPPGQVAAVQSPAAAVPATTVPATGAPATPVVPVPTVLPPAAADVPVTTTEPAPNTNLISLLITAEGPALVTPAGDVRLFGGPRSLAVLPSADAPGDAVARAAPDGTVFHLDVEGLNTGDISGKVFADLNGNGLQDEGEPDLTSQTVFLDLNRNGAHDPGEPSAVTNERGEYLFTGLPLDQTYRVRQEFLPYTVQTFPQAEWHVVTLSPQRRAASDVRFGLAQLPPPRTRMVPVRSPEDRVPPPVKPVPVTPDGMESRRQPRPEETSDAVFLVGTEEQEQPGSEEARNWWWQGAVSAVVAAAWLWERDRHGKRRVGR